MGFRSIESFLKTFFVSAVALFSFSVQAEEILILGLDAAPFSIAEDGKLSGIGPDVLRTLAHEIGVTVTLDSGVNLKRVYKESQRANVFFPTLARTPDRESTYHWIGRLIEETNCFLTMKGKPTISSIEDARKFIIGVYANGAGERFLRSQKVTSIEPMVSRTVSLQKLAKGRINAYYSGEHVAYFSILRANLNPKDFTCGKPIEHVSYYIAASGKTNPKLVEKFRIGFENLVKNQELDRLLRKYGVHESPW